MGSGNPMAWLLDAVIAITALEGLALWAWHRFTGGGLAPAAYALNLVSGLLLMLALRGALHGAPWPMTMACLAASGAAHGIDIWRRWPRRPLSKVSRPS
ncbi:hypothetical protein ACLIJR_04520 [Hydrogenophaga sp. XSHU_21]